VEFFPTIGDGVHLLIEVWLPLLYYNLPYLGHSQKSIGDYSVTYRNIRCGGIHVKKPSVNVILVALGLSVVTCRLW